MGDEHHLYQKTLAENIPYWSPAVHVYMHEWGRPWCECHYPTSQNRQVVEDRDSGCDGQKRGLASFEIPWLRELAKLEWTQPLEPRRNEPSPASLRNTLPCNSRIV
jgi:hypothetical protein